MTPTNPRGVQIIPVEDITILNPRLRNKRNFDDMVESIRKVGLKRPITVKRAQDVAGRPSYGLVCGQGRLEACMRLGQQHVPAIVIEAEETECLVMSLVENCARRHHRTIDLLQDIQTLSRRGYNDNQIAEKIGVGHEWVNMIRGLLAKGEQRLLMAVENGTIPISVAVEISRTEDDDLQALMTQAYTEGKVTGTKLIKLRWILERRKRIGKKITEPTFGRTGSTRRPTSTDGLIRVYRQEADRQRLLIKKAEITQTRLLFIVEAVRALQSDENFVNLLRAEDLQDMPRELSDRLLFSAVPL